MLSISFSSSQVKRDESIKYNTTSDSLKDLIAS